MTKVFFKSMFMLFMWLIVFINLVLAFQLYNTIPFLNATANLDPNKEYYFGMSSLITFLENLDSYQLPFISKFQVWLDEIYSQVNNALRVNWNEVWEVEVVDLVSFFTAFGLFFENLGKALSSIIVYISLLPLMLVYVLSFAIQIFFILLQLLSGAYALEVPHAPPSDIVIPTWDFSTMLPMLTLV